MLVKIKRKIKSFYRSWLGIKKTGRYRYKLNYSRNLTPRFFVKHKTLRKGAGFIFGLFLIFSILCGWSPLDILQKSIKALIGKTDKINLYASNCRPDNASADYHYGWWGESMAIGEPEVAPDGSLLDFSDNNSAFYVGGNFSLVCGEFGLLKTNDEAIGDLELGIGEREEDSDDGQDGDIDIGDEKIGNGNLEFGIGEENEVIGDLELGNGQEQESKNKGEYNELDDNVVGDLELGIREENEKDGDSELGIGLGIGDEENNDKKIIESKNINEENVDVINEMGYDAAVEEVEILDNNVEVEVINEKENTADDAEIQVIDGGGVEIMEVNIEDADSEDEQDEVSFLQKFKNIFGSLTAQAQEIIFGQVESLESLGKFRSAKIKFSLGIGDGRIGNLESEIGEESEVIGDSGLEIWGTGEEEGNKIIEERAVEWPEVEGGELDNGEIGNWEFGIGEEGESDGEAENLKLENGEGEEKSGEQGSGMDISDGETGNLEIEIGEEKDDIKELIESENIEDENVEIINEEGDDVAAEEVEVIDNADDGSDGVEIKEIDSGADDGGEISFMDKFVNSARAQGSDLTEVKIIIWYSLDAKIASPTNMLWQKLDVFSGDNLSNALNKDYFSYKADFLENWQDIENLVIKFEGVVKNKTVFAAYLDSVWVEAEYEAENELEKLEKRKRWEEALDLLSNQLVFAAGERGEFKFRYNKNENRIWDTLGEIVGLADFWRNVELGARLVDSEGGVLDKPLTIIFEEDGGLTIKLPYMPRGLRPGKYAIKFNIKDSSGDEPEEFILNQEFNWGILAMNFNKSVYLENEAAYIQMAVLDESGHTVCGVDLELSIKTPAGNTVILSQQNEQIINNPECGPETVISKPDYYAYYNFGSSGDYEIELKAKTASGEKRISEIIKVVPAVDFAIERAGPTRIYPKADYNMTMRINANQNFKGDIIEYAPVGFKIKDYRLKITNSQERDPFGSNYKHYEKIMDGEKKIVWQDIELLAGDNLEINYTFDAPNRSPELYLLGPLALEATESLYSDSVASRETRKWQIASDAVNKRARTVMFLAGTYSGNGTAGQNSDSNNTFSQFNFKLAETGVDIKSAFIIFEAQFEAYSNGGNNYSGYNLAFDACEETCTADAFGSGGGQVLKDDNTVLAYDETESNQARLLLDITNESQLASYTGAGAELEGQVGYRIERGAAVNSIANAKAVLVITYIYDIDSENITNTVAYPLDSIAGTDRGTLQTHQEGDCTFGVDCPQFDYNAEIPEFSGASSDQLSDWFRFYEVNDNNNTADSQVSAQIAGESIPSAAFIHETANGGTQGNIPAMYFSSVTGYAVNTSQTIGYRSYTNSATHDHALIGGEVFTTYIASSSAATSTRTVSFPLGVINNGNTTSLTSDEVDVYFPENGSATGTIQIKNAWLRIISHEHNSGARTMQVSTKVGNNATSTTLTYNYDAGGSVIKPSFNIVNIIPSSDYSALEEANAANPITVKVNTQNNNADAGGTSAELMITYIYTSETDGYLTSLKLFAGQSGTAPATTTIATTTSVMPELSGKKMLAGGLLANFLNSDNLGAVGAGTVFLADANISTNTPSCSPAYEIEPDDMNSFTEFYKDVTSAMGTVDNEIYNICYADDEVLTASDGAKMGGVLTYTYQWENGPPTGIFESAIQKVDGSGVVDIAVEINDPDGHDSRVKIEYATGTTCVFSPAGDPALDETDGNITADFGDPDIENDNIYQIGASDAYITTASGSNSVFFDWQSQSDLSNIEGDYCLRITANDLNLDQAVPATTTLYIDNLAPTAPGALSLTSRTGTTTTLLFGATSTETNFSEYKIFYKIYDGSDPEETDSVHASTTDINLGNKLFNSATTTVISALTPHITYSFAIWVYDQYGNRASSSRIDIETNDAPGGYFITSGGDKTEQRTDGSGIVDISIEVDDDNNDDTCRAKIEYATGTACVFSGAGDPSLDETPANINPDYGAVTINNNNEYQVGSSTGASGWIITSFGSNTVKFDWFGKIDAPQATSSYCLRLTVNDGLDNQLIATTAIITLDNVNPTAPGALSEGDITINSINLIFDTAATSSDTNEPAIDAYKIFYSKSPGVIDQATGDNWEHDDANLDNYIYNGAASTTVSGLDSNTLYYFNIWAYDQFGNKATATEISIYTDATLVNNSLSFTNPQGANTAVAGTSTEWNFRAVVSETNGWYAIASTTLRLADNTDSSSPFGDLEFYWDQTADSFYEIGNDALGAASLSANSTSTCAVNTCTLDFKINFNKTFTISSTTYAAEIYSANDSGTVDFDSYPDFYQVRFPYVEQIHYRWRNDDGGE